jgi:hypothetical protein
LKWRTGVSLRGIYTKPDLVVGIPVSRANFCFAELIPKALFQENEKPNLLAIDFILISYRIILKVHNFF